MYSETRTDIMGMPITILLPEGGKPAASLVFEFFTAVDARFSTYKSESEVSRYNRGEIPDADISPAFREVLALCEQTRVQTNGYFNARRPDGYLDPSGVVKSWALLRAEAIVQEAGYESYFLDAGGDIASSPTAPDGTLWRIGIRSPFARTDIVKVVTPRGKGLATSGNAIRGDHIWNPHGYPAPVQGVASITVIADDILEADRFATAAYAMGEEGIAFIEMTPGLEGYLIRSDETALLTSGFPAYVAA